MKKNDQGRDQEAFDKQLKRFTFEEWKSRTGPDIADLYFDSVSMACATEASEEKRGKLWVDLSESDSEAPVVGQGKS